MDHVVIPAPARFDVGGGPGFAFRPGTVVAYADTEIAPVVGRFCAQIARRTGLRLAPVRGNGPPTQPSVTIKPAAAREPAGPPASASLSPAGLSPGHLPAPVGLSPSGGAPAGERYSLVI